MRKLPWRGTREPYRIWVSEIMLQQTRAVVVSEYFERFLRHFPSLEALARAPEAEVQRRWSGLGYYSRARNLRLAAREIVFERGGQLPETAAEWRQLAGVGPYTAAAIASIAFGEPVAALDGNVARVMARLTNHHGDIGVARVRAELAGRAQELLDRRRPGEFNQAMMELGATVCLPRTPRCTLCPVEAWCEARRAGVEEQLPVKLRGREPVALSMHIALVRRNGRILLRRRPDEASLMPGFWEAPEAGGGPWKLADAVARFRHSITHHNYTVTAYRATLAGRLPPGYRWVGLREMRKLPLTTITRKALEQSRAAPRRRARSLPSE